MEQVFSYIIGLGAAVMMPILQIKYMILIVPSVWHTVSDEYAVSRIPSVCIFKFGYYGRLFYPELLIFLGANMDAVEEAEKIGIRRTHAASYKNDAKGVKLNYAVAGKVLSCMRSDDCSMEEKMLKVPEFLRSITEHLEEDD